jgi:hypothetical protein
VFLTYLKSMMIIWLKLLKQSKDMTIEKTIEKVFIDTSAFYALMDRSDI